MADSNTPNAANAAPTVKSRQLIAVKDLKALQIVEDVLAASQVAGRPARFLNERDLNSAFFTDTGNRTTTARQKATAMSNHMLAQKTATTDEAKFKKALAKAVGTIQSAAAQKLAGSAPNRLKLYGIGKNVLTMSRTDLLQMIPTLLQAASDDAPLPGVSTAQISAVQDNFQAWNDADTAQTAATTALSQAHDDLVKLLYGDENDRTVPSLEADRRTIQYAADGLWPPGTEVAIRREFKLQANKRFSVKTK